jgi:hypothetical protein
VLAAVAVEIGQPGDQEGNVHHAQDLLGHGDVVEVLQYPVM